MTTLQDDLDAAIPAAPVLPSVEDTLHAGRTALRRRRTGAVSGLVAAAAVVGVVTVTALGGTGADTARPVPPADQTTEPTPGETQWLEPGTDQLFDDHPFEMVQWDTHGVLLLRPGARVVHRWENPGDLPAPGRYLAAVIESAGATYWSYAAWNGVVGVDGDSRYSVTVTPGMTHGLPFERWVHDEIAGTDIGRPAPDYVRLGPDGRLAPVGDATILDQTSDVEGLVHPENAVGAIGLVRTGPAELCVYAGQVPGREPGYSYVPASLLGPDLHGCRKNIGAGWWVE